MAQANYTPISLYYSTTASAAPSAGNLVNGELAINITDGKLYYKDNGGTVKVIAGTGGTGVVAGSNTQIQFNNNGVFGASSSLTWNGSKLTTQDIALTGNVTSNLLFSADNTYDIGASGATRPRNYFGAGNGTFGGNLAQGTTSSAWSGYTALDLPNAGYVSSGNSYLSALMNAYYNGSSYVRKGTGSALELLLQGSGFTFNAAASSTAGSTFSYSTIGYLSSSSVATGQTTLCLQNQASASNIILSTTSGGVSNASIEYRANAHSFQIGTSEKLGVLNGGNIGIRTANVIGAGNIFLDGASAAAGYFEPYNSVDGNTSIVNTGPYNILFKTNNTTKGLFTSGGKFLVGTTTERNTLTVVSGVSAPVPTLGTASGSAFFGGSNVLYGCMIGVDPSGPTWIQGQRVDGTATAYNLWLQPSGGSVTVGYNADPGVRMGVGATPSSGGYDGFQVLRASGGTTVVGLWQTGSAYSYGSVGANSSWIYSNYGPLHITADGNNDLYFSMGNGSTATNRVKLRNNGAFTVLSGGGSDNSVTGLILFDDGDSKITALSNNSSRNLRISAENIAFWTGTTYSSKATLYDNGCFSIGGTVNNAFARLILNGETNYNMTTPGTAIGTMHFAGQLSADYSNAITWNGGTGTTGAMAGIYVQGSGAYGTKMYFATTDSYAIGSKTRMQIDQNGAVNIGQLSTSYSALLNVNGGIFTRAFQINMESTSSSTPFEYVLRSGTAMNFYVSNASVLATLSASGVWTNASDARYKENIRPVAYGLAEVMRLQPRAYNIIGSEKQEIGFVAQEVQPILPELVESALNSVTNEDRLTLSYGQMSAVLVKAIQELKAEFDAYVATHP